MTNVVLFLHIGGALIFVAGTVVAGLAFEQARKRQDSGEIALLLGMTRSGVALVGIGALLILLCGLWLIGLEDEVGWGSGWVDAALALFVLAMLLDDRSPASPTTPPPR